LQGSAQSTGVSTDTASGFENLLGSAYADTLQDDDTANSISGGESDDVLVGGLGNDRLDGGLGSDTASYYNAGGAVNVSLAIACAQNTGAAGTDTLVSIENLTGSAFADRLTGDGGANHLTALMATKRCAAARAMTGSWAAREPTL